MQQSPDSALSSGSPAEPSAGSLMSSLLIAFTVLVAVACAFVLASTLTQTRMSSITIDGVTLNIWKLDDIRSRWEAARSQLDILAADIADTERKRRNLAIQSILVEEQYQIAAKPLLASIAELNSRVGIPNPTLERPNDTRQNFPDPAEQYGQIQSRRELILREHEELRPLLAQIDKAYSDFLPAHAARVNVVALNQSAVLSIINLQAALSGSKTSLDALFLQISDKIDNPTRTRVENALYELHSGLFGKYLNRLITLQPDILTLFLVILMGILGSSLQITYSFFKRRRVDRLGAYFVRLCVGAITALVIFIVAKAGVPVIADASRLGGDAPINPYFVSFLAIISGLMSENAILSVQTQAVRFFGPEGSGDAMRWARYDLQDEFTKANRNPDEVKRLLDADGTEFKDWISGQKSMPADAQRMIAGVLGKPQRELFTDIAPDDPDSTGKNKPLATP